MKKLLFLAIFAFVVFGAFAQSFSRSAYTSPDMALQWVKSQERSNYLAGFKEVIPLFAPVGVSTITVKIWEQQDYFGQKIKATEAPKIVFTAEYSNGQLTSLSRDGEEWIMKVNYGYGSISSCVVYNSNTGQKIGEAIDVSKYERITPLGTNVGSDYVDGEYVDFYYSYDRGDRVKYVGDDYGSYDPYETDVLLLSKCNGYWIISDEILTLRQSKSKLVGYYGRSTWKDITKQTGTQKARKTVRAYVYGDIGSLPWSLYYTHFNEAGMKIKASADVCLRNGVTYRNCVVEYEMW